MIINVKTKAIAFFMMISIQYPAYAITSAYTGAGALFTGLMSAAVAEKCDANKFFVGAVFVTTASLTAIWLKKYTPVFKLEKIESGLDTVEKNPHAIFFVPKNREKSSMFEEIRDERCLQTYSTQEYQNIMDRMKYKSSGHGEHALAKAYESMVALYPHMEKISAWVNEVREDAYADDLGQKWGEANNRYLNYKASMEKVDCLIREWPEYKTEAVAYEQRKLQMKAYAIQQQNADTQTKAVESQIETSKINAQANLTNAKAVRSWVLLEWIKSWFSSSDSKK